MTRRRPTRPNDDGATDEPRALSTLLAALASTLRETEELPVPPAASVWLGEAHAVAADLVDDTVDRRVVHERVSHVQHLLENAGDVDNDAAAAHVDDALVLAAEVLERTATDGERES